MDQEHRLTKSTFCSGVQCSRLLYYNVNLKGLLPEPDPATLLKFDQGTEVTEAARLQYPDGVMIEHEPWDEIIERTQHALHNNAPVIFEGAFFYNHVLIKADILQRVGGEAYNLIEVKMSTKLKPEHIPDIAIQKYVLEGSGMKIEKANLMHINKNYMHPGQGELFCLVDCTEEVEEFMHRIEDFISEQLGVLEESQPPEEEIGPHCREPHDCPLIAECWKDIPEPSVFDIPKLWWTKKWDLYDQGIIELKDIPEDYKLNAKQQNYIDSVRRDEPNIDTAAIRKKLDELQYPLYFMDFETMNWAIPKFEGTKPYQQVPFQWSLHVLDKEENLTHQEFLADYPDDSREAFTASLLEAIGSEGSVIVYYKNFENSRLKELVEWLPQHEEAIQSIIDRVWDLWEIFAKHYMDPRFRGSNSIKKVLPVIVPELSYKDLEIGDGNAAQAGWVEMLNSEGNEREHLRRCLLEYCKMDTLAMVELLGNLREL